METFKGYKRPNGEVGVRNNILIIPTVCCANGVVKMIADAVPEAIPMYHPGGCGKLHEAETHSRILANIAKNPNTYAAAYVGLGCEILKAKEIAEQAKKENPNIYVTVIQEDGGSKRTAEGAIAFLKEKVEEAKRLEREDCPFSKLTIGLECGGSDALSGITANPAIGFLSDWIVEKGGRAILTETTEFCGTKDTLGKRGATPEICAKIVEFIERGEHHAVEILGPNASRAISPGNMDGGMSTIQEKSFGCIQKAGTSLVEEVLEHGEIPTKSGLSIMDGPGFDTESLTGLFSGGAQISIFSTGRGNPIGHPGMPVIKLASNSKVFNSMPGDMDINAGVILDGVTLEELGNQIVEYVKDVANGKQTVAEENNQGGILCLYTFSRSF